MGKQQAALRVLIQDSLRTLPVLRQGRLYGLNREHKIWKLFSYFLIKGDQLGVSMS